MIFLNKWYNSHCLFKHFNPPPPDFIDVLTPAARVQGGYWYGDTYSGAGISAWGEGRGRDTGKWLENETLSNNQQCIQMVCSKDVTALKPHGNIEWNASGLSGGLNENIDDYSKYLLLKMNWEPVQRAGHWGFITGYFEPWNLNVKLNGVETLNIDCRTTGSQVVDVAGYGGYVYSFQRVMAHRSGWIHHWDTHTSAVHELKQLIDLRTGGISSTFGENLTSGYWTSSVNLHSPKFNNTDNFKLYVSAIAPPAWENWGGTSTDWLVDSVKLGGFGVSASRLDNISYNDFLSL